MNPGIVDYFEPEAAIVARVRAALPDATVFTPFSLGDMVEASQPSPAVHVIYNGDALGGNEAGHGQTRVIDQRWIVVLSARTARAQLQSTHDVRNYAGKLIPPLLASLQGWAPVEWMRPLRRVSGPPVGYSSSFAYFPFMFEGRIIT